MSAHHCPREGDPMSKSRIWWYASCALAAFLSACSFGGQHGSSGGGGAGGTGSGWAGAGGTTGGGGVGSTGTGGFGNYPGGDGGVVMCIPGVAGTAITDCGYPYSSTTPLTNVVFNEVEVLRAIEPAG